MTKHPVCTVIAGPNGAGKSTFALQGPFRLTSCRNFVNADSIAAGLSPFAPERELITASQLFLNEIHRYARERESFAFETTLAGKTHANFISKLVKEGWLVEMTYLWISSANLSLDRVRERVAHGGHNIPVESIFRRYPKSIRNLLYVYSDLCTSTFCLDNTNGEPGLIFTQNASERRIINANIYEQLVQIGSDTV